jgi:hypothetical protein
MLSAYIWNVYLNHNLEIDPKTGKEIYVPNIPILWVLGCLLSYPVYNDGNQMLKYGMAYFASIVNYVDIFQIFMGFYSIVN